MVQLHVFCHTRTSQNSLCILYCDIWRCLTNHKLVNPRNCHYVVACYRLQWVNNFSCLDVSNEVAVSSEVASQWLLALWSSRAKVNSQKNCATLAVQLE